MMAKAVEWEVDHADPDFPTFFRFDDSNAAMGGPNPDNDYYMARVRGDSEYRITVDLSNIFDVNLSVHEGNVCLGKTAKWGDIGRRDVIVGPDEKFELILGPTPRPGNWLKLEPEASFVWLRIYYTDWQRHRPADIRIERLGSDAEYPNPLSPPILAERFERAATFFEGHVKWYTDWALKAETPVNEPAPLRGIGISNSNVAYGWCNFDIPPDAALIVEFDRPEARHWGTALLSFPWMNNSTLAHRVTSLNATSADVDGDGRVRIVVAHRDPGVRNWLDIDDHRRGLIFHHRMWPDKLDEPTVKLVSLDEVRHHLPAATPGFSPAQREQQMRIRREHMAARRRL
jgi:hypothetical protein